jgi:hypothetical protein
MTDVPETPKEFFSQYIPNRFQLFKSGLEGKSSSGSMVFRVVGAGEWSLRLKNGELSRSSRRTFSRFSCREP